MPDIRHSVQIASGFADIYPLVSTAKGFSQWWTADVVQVPSTQLVDLYFFNRATHYRLQPTQIVAPFELTWFCLSGNEWSGTRINFKLAPKVNETVLHFRHADWDAETDYFIACNTTWGELLYRLKAAAQGLTPGPLFSKSGMAY